MNKIKMVGKSGQISLGKALAGMGFIAQELPGGDIVLKRAVVEREGAFVLLKTLHIDHDSA